jgi:hypothetical protein
MNRNHCPLSAGKYNFEEIEEERSADPKEKAAKNDVSDLFESSREEVFFSRQIEVRLENKYFHWITNRAIRNLVDVEELKSEIRSLQSGGKIRLLWWHDYRYYKRSAARVIKTVEEYAAPNIAGSIGLHGEMMVLEGFARFQFVMRGRNTQEYGGKKWDESEHNLDFIFERDGLAYGLEVKNTLGYMDYKELLTKIEICKHLGLKPVFVARMLPKAWIKEIVDEGDFALILKYQLYPWTHKDLAEKVKRGLGLPVDSPKVIEDGTMKRFMKWHKKKL